MKKYCIINLLVICLIGCKNSTKNELFVSDFKAFVNGDYKNAIMLGKKKLKSDSSNFHCWNSIGLYYLVSAHFDSAKPYFYKSIELSNGEYHEPYLNLGSGFLTLSDTSLALENYQKAYNLAPNDVTVQYNFARLAEIIGAYDEARKLYSRIIKKHKNYKDSEIRYDSISSPEFLKFEYNQAMENKAKAPKLRNY